MRRFLVVLVGLSACVTTHLTPEAERVMVTTNVEAVRGCKLLGDIDASDRMNGGMIGQMAAEENATRRLKNKAAEMGATHVLFTSSTTGRSGSRTRGEAYQCTAPAP
jgi:uncharacterized protein YbjQ (UPF0145 family)